MTRQELSPAVALQRSADRWRASGYPEHAADLEREARDYLCQLAYRQWRKERA